jgi:hypothetical protein
MANRQNTEVAQTFGGVFLNDETFRLRLDAPFERKVIYLRASVACSITFISSSFLISSLGEGQDHFSHRGPVLAQREMDFRSQDNGSRVAGGADSSAVDADDAVFDFMALRLMREQSMCFQRHARLFPTAERAAALRLFAPIDNVCANRAALPPMMGVFQSR